MASGGAIEVAQPNGRDSLPFNVGEGVMPDARTAEPEVLDVLSFA